MKNVWFNISSWFEYNHKIIEFGLTVCALLATFLLLYQTKIQADLSQKSIDRADSALFLTKQSLALAESNSIIENRAWVGLASQPILTTASFDKGSYIYIEIKNYGKTPAEGILCSGKIFFSNELPKPLSMPLLSTSPWVLSPGESFRIEIEVDSRFNESVYHKIALQKMKIFVGGIISYKDLYGRTNTTEFISKYDYRFGFQPFGEFNRMN